MQAALEEVRQQKRALDAKETTILADIRALEDTIEKQDVEWKAMQSVRTQDWYHAPPPPPPLCFAGATACIRH